jgi:hypothetical protein
MTLWIILYSVIAVLVYVRWVFWFRESRWVNFEDLFCGLIMFGILWPIGGLFLIWHKFDIGYAILGFVNKKRWED